MSAVCEQLFRQCLQNDWASLEEKSGFLSNCERDQPAKPGRTPNVPPPTFQMSVSLGGVSHALCRGYAGTTHREAAPERSWYITPLAWAAAAGSAALFILGVRAIPGAMPNGSAPATYPFGIKPFSPSNPLII